jgi:hypothetical protein
LSEEDVPSRELDEDEPRSEEEEELYRQLEDQIAKVRMEDVLIQSTVSLLNLAARRIAKEDERDLEQGRLGIEAVRLLVGLLPEDAARQVREGLSQVQVVYAREAGGGGGRPASESGEAAETPPPQPKGAKAEPPPRIWTPPGSVS